MSGLKGEGDAMIDAELVLKFKGGEESAFETLVRKYMKDAFVFCLHLTRDPQEAPYLPNVIVSSNPFIRPDDYGIPQDAEHWDDRTIRNVKMPWPEVKESKNFLWERGYQFYCLTPKTRHRVHSGWSNVDWHITPRCCLFELPTYMWCHHRWGILLFHYSRPTDRLNCQTDRFLDLGQ